MSQTKRIEKLTQQQQDMMPAWRDKWIAIGLSTERADRARFEAAIPVCYRAAKLEPPKRIVWTTSPMAVAMAAPLAARILKNGVAVGGAVGDAVGDAVRVAVGDATLAGSSGLGDGGMEPHTPRFLQTCAA